MLRRGDGGRSVVAISREASVRRVNRSNSLLTLFLSVAACAHSGASSLERPTQTMAGTAAKVDLEVKDAELLDTLGQLAGKGGINIFADSDLNDGGL